MHQMIRYEAACKALAEAKAIDEVQDVRNKADAMRIYGMQAKNKTLEVDAAEIRIRAERRLGQLILDQKAGEGLSVGGRPANKPVVTNDQLIPTLSEAGISKDLSSRAQKLATVPEEKFEAEVGEWRARVKKENARVTTRLAKAAEPEAGAPETMDAIETLQQELAEAHTTIRDLAEELEAFQTATESEAAAAKEIKTLREQVRIANALNGQWINKCNALVSQVKALRRKLGQS